MCVQNKTSVVVRNINNMANKISKLELSRKINKEVLRFSKNKQNERKSYLQRY